MVTGWWKTARGGLSELRHLAQWSAAGRGAQGPAAPARCRGDLGKASLGVELGWATCGYSWLFMAVHGCLWLFMAVYGCLWLFMAIHGYAWL